MQNFKRWVTEYAKASKMTAPDNQWFTFLIYVTLAPVVLCVRYLRERKSPAGIPGERSFKEKENCTQRSGNRNAL